MTKLLEKDHQFLTRTISSLTDQIDLFETFQDLSLKIVSQFDLKAILSTFCGIIKEVIVYQSSAIYLFNESGKGFFKIYPLDTPEENNTEDLPESSIITWVMDQGRWTVVTDFQDQAASSIMSILPIKSPQQAVGFMVMITEFDPALYNQKLSSILNFLASQTAIAIENQSLVARINNSNAYLTNMLESISNGIMAVNMKGEVTLINKNVTAILGIKTKHIIGRHYQSFLKGNMRQEMDQLFIALRDKGFAMESMVHHSPFREIHIMVGITASLLTDRNKNTIGIVFIFRDMSASREIERLTRLDEMKSEFVSLVSHELRAPLTALNGGLEVALQSAESLPPTARRTLEAMMDESARLTQFVQTILDVSRLEAGRLTLNLGPVAVAPILHRSVEVVLGTRREVQWNLPAEVPPVWADEVHYEQILRNLLLNADKYSPAEKPIEIRVQVSDGNVSVEVADHGAGIPPEMQAKIFERFQRGHSGESAPPGWGLGLYFAKKLTEAQSGALTLRSPLWPDRNAPGSAFTVTMPVAADVPDEVENA